MKSSLNTFLNAFTYPDRTCYPVASTNTQVGKRKAASEIGEVGEERHAETRGSHVRRQGSTEMLVRA